MFRKVFAGSYGEGSHWKCLSCFIPRPKPIALAATLPFGG